MTTTEAFDPFATDDDDDVVHMNSFLLDTTMNISNRSSSSSSNPTTTTHRHASLAQTPASQSINVKAVKANSNALVNEFNDTFPSMTLDDHVDVGDDALFGFTSSLYFPKENNIATAKSTTTSTTTTATSTFIITEEMSVMHKSFTNQCSVHVRGTVSVSIGSSAPDETRKTFYNSTFGITFPRSYTAFHVFPLSQIH